MRGPVCLTVHGKSRGPRCFTSSVHQAPRIAGVGRRILVIKTMTDLMAVQRSNPALVHHV